ncbi:MAG: glycoside hydrolase family 127 protein [Rubrivivax sp.]
MSGRADAPLIRTRLGGWLGAALAASRRGRLTRFIDGPDAPAVRLFDPAVADQHRDGDWYGEHAGKWLQAAARAAAAADDAALQATVDAVAATLVGWQRPDGYLGCYAEDRRFTAPQPPAPPSWDGAPAWRTWDVWVHACLLAGLLEAARHQPRPALLAAAQRIGALCERSFVDGGIDIVGCGNHHGLSALVLIDPLVQLHQADADPRWLRLAEHLLARADAHPPLQLLQRLRAGRDASDIATGKAYQLLWTGVGLARLQRATGRADLLQALRQLWANVRDHHLTIGGGPWGGVAHRSREVFNPAGVFSPQGYVETCSTMAWIGLNRELLAIDGDAACADAVEQSAYNDLLAAAGPDGEDWCYYVFGNGRRAHTTRWRCCKSSGALALEELPPLALGWTGDDGGTLRVQLYGDADSSLAWPDGRRIGLRQRTRYPADGAVRFELRLPAPQRLTLALRVPPWAEGARLTIDGSGFDAPAPPGGWLRCTRTWTGAERIAWQLPMPLRRHERVHRNVQESKAPDGRPVRQEVQRTAWVAFGRGPLVYAAGLVDGWRTEETLRLPDAPLADWLHEQPDPDAPDGAPALRLHPPGRGPITLWPAYRAGGRTHGAWRTTWFQLPPDPALPWTDEPEP